MSDWLGMAARPAAPRPELRGAVLARAVRVRRRRVLWAYAAAAALVGAVLGAGAWARSRMEALERAGAALGRELAAARDTLAMFGGRHTRVVQIPVTTGGRLGSVTIFDDTVNHRWLVRCENLAPNEPDQAYQLWFVTQAGLRPARVMPMDTDAPMNMVLELPWEGGGVSGAAMSIEPRAGSAELTGPTVFKELL